MSAPWQRAHHELLQVLPVRTHRRPPDPEPRQGGRPAGTTAYSEQRRRLIRRLLEEGLHKKEIAKRLDVSLKTVQTYAAAIAAAEPQGPDARRSTPKGEKSQ